LPRAQGGRLVEVLDDGPWRGAQVFLPNTLMIGPVIDSLKDAAKAHAQAERMRLLYVGMTRAADELYICGSVNKIEADKVPKDSWYPNVSAVVQDVGGLTGVRIVEGDPELMVWRFGAEPKWSSAAVLEISETTIMPDWAETAVKPRLKTSAPLLASRDSDSFDRQAAAQGIATHRLIELMADAESVKRVPQGKSWAKRLGLPDDVVKRVDDMLGLPELAAFFGPDGQSEVSIDGVVPGLGRVTGRVDRLAIGDGVIHLLDYKTNRTPLTAVPTEHPYAGQMAAYAALLLQAYPDHAIKAALFWTQSGALTWLTPTLLSQALELRMKETA
jgi:ATP-dependent helicase/nuclease subunit A